MKKIISKGFTLVELIIVMVLLGILAAVAVPRMSQSIMAAEEAAEQKFLSSLISAIEIYAADEFVRNSSKRYPDFDHGIGPFAVLDKVPQRNSNGEGWWVEHHGGWNDGGSRSGQHFKIKHRRTTKSSPDYYTIKDITDKRDYYLNRRKLYLQMLAAGVSYRSFLGLRSSFLYDQYSKNSDKADERHRKIVNIDKQKPLFDVLSGISVFPIIYYHAKYLEMVRWLKN